MTPAGIGVIGCGKVSQMYLPVLTRISTLRVVGVADIDPDLATRVAEQYGVAAAPNPEALLADRSIDVIVNLTPIAAHVAVTRAALSAGKHVYSEKPLAIDTDEATALATEAQQRGLLLGCAPDTLLGTGFHAAREAIADGRIGRPLSATASMFRSELPAPSFYTEGATPFFDMAPYYLTALVTLFGPARRVSGAIRTWPAGSKPETSTPAGASIAFGSVLEFDSGALATLTMSWGTSHPTEIPIFTVHGTTGTVHVPNPNNFDDPAYIQQYDAFEPTELPTSRQPAHWPSNLRGLGVADLVHAVQNQREPRTGADLACHVVEAIAGTVRSGRTGERVELTTSCVPPPPLSDQARCELFA